MVVIEHNADGKDADTIPFCQDAKEGKPYQAIGRGIETNPPVQGNLIHVVVALAAVFPRLRHRIKIKRMIRFIPVLNVYFLIYYKSTGSVL